MGTDCAHSLREVLADVAYAYGLSAHSLVARQCRPHSEVWLLQVGPEYQVFKAIRDAPEARRDIAEQHQVLQFLHERGYRCTRSVATRGAQVPYVNLPEGRLGILYTHISGRACVARPDDYSAAGRSLARLHNALDSVGSLTLRQRHDAATLIDHPLASLRARIGGAAVYAQLEDIALKMREWLVQLPQQPGAYGVCHGDAHLDNAKINEMGNLEFYDFALLGLGWRAYDLATCIWGTLTERYGAQLWDALLQSYAAERAMDEREVVGIRVFVILRDLWWLGFRSRLLRSETPASVERDVIVLMQMAGEVDVATVLKRAVV